MELLRRGLRIYLWLRYSYRRLTRSGAFGPAGAVYLPQPVRLNAHNPLQQALFRHYVRQFHESSCSVASVAMALNAIMDRCQMGGQPTTQFELLDRVTTGNWKQRMSPGGDRGKRGLPLPLLGQVVASALAVYGIEGAQVETVPAIAANDRNGAARKQLIDRLQRFESRGDCLLIAHFDQGAYLPTLNIPHISPVGSYDAATGRVTILDVDATQPGPYAVEFETFFRGIASNYHHIFRPFGYRSGGYVCVHLKAATRQEHALA